MKKGELMSEKQKNLIRLSNKKTWESTKVIRISKIKSGENSPNWKGLEVGYVSNHEYVRSIKPKASFCKICKEDKKLDLAATNHGKGVSRNPDDYIWLCRKCHMNFDNQKAKSWSTRHSKVNEAEAV